MTGKMYEQTCSKPSTDSYKICTQLIFKYYFFKCSQNFHPPSTKKVLQNHFHVILSDLSMDAPGRPWTPLYAPVSKYYFKKCSQNFHPPPSQKVLQNHFQVILSDLSLDAPVRPFTPLCQNAFCLTSPGAGACHPPPYIHHSDPNRNIIHWQTLQHHNKIITSYVVILDKTGVICLANMLYIS